MNESANKKAQPSAARNPKIKRALLKVTNQAVKQIRKMLAAGLTTVRIGKKFGISGSQVSRINTGKSRRRPFRSPEQRFWEKVNKSGPRIPDMPEIGRCWVWTAFTDEKGYGHIGLNGKVVSAHRMSWALHWGPIPEGMVIMHRCDNPPCVNPRHLELGEQLDNRRDCVEKGRNNPPRGADHFLRRHPERVLRGENSPAATLTEDQVREIKMLLFRGKTGRSIAISYGISDSIVSRIKNRNTWAHVTINIDPELIERGELDIPGRFSSRERQQNLPF